MSADRVDSTTFVLPWLHTRTLIHFVGIQRERVLKPFRIFPAAENEKNFYFRQKLQQIISRNRLARGVYLW